MANNRHGPNKPILIKDMLRVKIGKTYNAYKNYVSWSIPVEPKV